MTKDLYLCQVSSGSISYTEEEEKEAFEYLEDEEREFFERLKQSVINTLRV